MTASEIIETLKRCEIFSSADETDIEKIASLCQIISAEPGGTILTQGEYGAHIYLISEGQVALIRSVGMGGREGTMTVDILGKGRGFGWSSILCDPCSVSVSAVCQKPTRFVCISGNELRLLLEENPSLGFKVMDRLAQVIGNRLRAVYGAIDTFK